MRLASLTRRIAALEPELVNSCSFCDCISERVESLSEEDLRVLIAFLEGKCATVSPELEKWFSEIPESSPTCPHCQRTAVMSEEGV